MELYKIESCRSLDGCLRAVSNTAELKQIFERILKELEFTKKRGEKLGDKAKQYHILKVCLAGCANGCSKPQIKDFSIIAKVLPSFIKERCNLCGLCSQACSEQGLKIYEGELVFTKKKMLGMW